MFASRSATTPTVWASFKTQVDNFADRGPLGLARELRAVLAAHKTPDGVVFDSGAWVVTAAR